MTGIESGGPSRRRQLRVAALIVVGVAVLGGLVWWAVAARGGAAAGQPSAPSTSPDGSTGTTTSSPTASASASASVDPTVPPPDAADDPTPAKPTTPVDENGTPVPGARPSAPPVDLSSPAAPAEGVRVDLASIEAVEGKGTIPGEVGGPALRVTVQVTNRTDAPIDLRGAVANLYYGPDRIPATTLLEPGARSLPDSVAPGASVTGVWVFNVPVADRDVVEIEVDLSADDQVVVFSGAVG